MDRRLACRRPGERSSRLASAAHVRLSAALVFRIGPGKDSDFRPGMSSSQPASTAMPATPTSTLAICASAIARRARGFAPVTRGCRDSCRALRPPWTGWVCLELFQPHLRVAEAIEFHAHAIHQRKMQTARAAVVVRLVEVIEDPSGPDRAVALAGDQERQLVRAVRI